MTAAEVDWLLVYLLVLMLLVEVTAGVVVLWTLTSMRKNPKSRQACRRALIIALAAAAAGAAIYVILGARIGLIDLSGPPRGRLAIGNQIDACVSEKSTIS